MLELLYKENINISDLDIKLSENIEEVLLNYKNEDIYKAVSFIESKQNYSIFFSELKSYLLNEVPFYNYQF